MRILGLSAFYHDSAAALVEDGRIVAAAQQEQFARRKHNAGFPDEAIRYCLRARHVDLDQVDQIVFFEKPLIKFERLLETYLANAPYGFQSFQRAIPLWIKEKLFQRPNLEKALAALTPSGSVEGKLLFAEHHQSHAASAFFPSPFEDAAVLTMDGVGEWATTSVSIGRHNKLEPVLEIHWPTHRVHARGRLPLLHGHRYGDARNRQLHPKQARSRYRLQTNI
jgi:carbamoyltransferase